MFVVLVWFGLWTSVGWKCGFNDWKGWWSTTFDCLCEQRSQPTSDIPLYCLVYRAPYVGILWSPYSWVVQSPISSNQPEPLNTAHVLWQDQQHCSGILLATNTTQIHKFKRTAQTFYQNAKLISGLTRYWQRLLRLILPKPLWRTQVRIYHITCGSTFITCLQHSFQGTSKHFNGHIWSCQNPSFEPTSACSSKVLQLANRNRMMALHDVGIYSYWHREQGNVVFFLAGSALLYGIFYSWSSYPHYQIWIQSQTVAIGTVCRDWMKHLSKYLHCRYLSINIYI